MKESEPIRTVPALDCGSSNRCCRRNLCTMWPIIPEEQRAGMFPCHYIPLGSRNETIASLLANGDKSRLEQTLLDWVRRLPSSAKTLVWESGLLTAFLYEIQPIKEYVEQAM